eukprot:NODE_982_length_2555_cov_0.594055.p2 type:complete len:290 gc:universal NODE_982_length_2555_cov_0.594055:2287-1418(-)
MPFDVHCHAVHDLSGILSEKLQYSAIMTTNPEECKKVLTLPNHPKILKGLGFHPWFVNKYEYNESWYINQLDSGEFNLVGEIGIDKVATDLSGKKYDMDTQIKIFESLFIIACKYQLPVSIHCARAYGYLAEFFKSLQCINDTISNRQRRKLEENFYESSSEEDDENHLLLCKSKLCLNRCKIAPKIMVHSYSGSIETSQQFLNLSFGKNIYFSFSAVVNRRSIKKFENAIRSIPLNRILLESDIQKPEEIIQFMDEIVAMSANALNITEAQVARFALENGKAFYQLSS